jgi:hypothetical protein
MLPNSTPRAATGRHPYEAYPEHLPSSAAAAARDSSGINQAAASHRAGSHTPAGPGASPISPAGDARRKAVAALRRRTCFPRQVTARPARGVPERWAYLRILRCSAWTQRAARPVHVVTPGRPIYHRCRGQTEVTGIKGYLVSRRPVFEAPLRRGVTGGGKCVTTGMALLKTWRPRSRTDRDADLPPGITVFRGVEGPAWLGYV